MKLSQFLILTGTLFLSAQARAAVFLPTANEMAANFQVCEKSDESWHRRWGQFLVSYDLNEAAKICNESAYPAPSGSPALMGCRVNGKYVWAGYYCQDVIGLE